MQAKEISIVPQTTFDFRSHYVVFLFSVKFAQGHTEKMYFLIPVTLPSYCHNYCTNKIMVDGGYLFKTL